MSDIELGDLDTDEYREATRHAECDGCRGAFSPPDHTRPMRDWHDKPRRLVRDLCAEIDRLRAELVRVAAQRDSHKHDRDLLIDRADRAARELSEALRKWPDQGKSV